MPAQLNNAIITIMTKKMTHAIVLSYHRVTAFRNKGLLLIRMGRAPISIAVYGNIHLTGGSSRGLVLLKTSV